jgi:predicted DNA-binding transcriptional regulator YafY
MLQLFLRGSEFIPIVELTKKMGMKRVSVYRLLDQLKKDNIPVIKDRGKQAAYKIHDDNVELQPKFNPAEADIIYNALFNGRLKEDLSNKLYKLVLYNSNAIDLDSPEITIIKKAIKDGKKIKIGSYYGREEVKRNHFITPVHFDEKSLKVYCYEKEIKNFKSYNLERMRGVFKTSEKRETYPEWKPKNYKADVFGFHYSGKSFKVKLKMSIFASSLLKRQFPILEKYISEKETDRGLAEILEVEVFDPQPISRFVTGLLNEVEILGSSEAKNEIKKYIRQRVLEPFKKW